MLYIQGLLPMRGPELLEHKRQLDSFVFDSFEFDSSVLDNSFVLSNFVLGNFVLDNFVLDSSVFDSFGLDNSFVLNCNKMDLSLQQIPIDFDHNNKELEMRILS